MYPNCTHATFSVNEIQKLKEKFSDFESRIKNLDDQIAIHGYKYESHYRTILKWAEKDKPKVDPEIFA